jgi:hypothetical protein
LTENYKSFVHIYNQDGELVTQDDIFPELPTRYWYFGEEFMLFYLLNAPLEGWQAGTYSVETGWYDENDALSRLVINPGEEERTTYTLFSFTVNEDGTIVLPEFELPAEATESAIEGAPAPDLTPTGALPESTEASG